MQPKTIEHVFTNATVGDVGKIVRFDFVSCLMDLLLDTDLMSLENLVINPDAPYTKYVSPDGLLDEINSGCWYDRAYTKESPRNICSSCHSSSTLTKQVLPKCVSDSDSSP
jgi:hypothetical protein